MEIDVRDLTRVAPARADQLSPGDRIDSDPVVDRVERNGDMLTIYFTGSVTVHPDDVFKRWE